MKKRCGKCGGIGRIVKEDTVPWPECDECDGEGVVSIDFMGLILQENIVTVHQ